MRASRPSFESEDRGLRVPMHRATSKIGTLCYAVAEDAAFRVTFVLRRLRILSRNEATNPMFLQNERSIFFTSAYVTVPLHPSAGTAVSGSRTK
jgi:hypothetical protein